jgi:hypothetical protein
MVEIRGTPTPLHIMKIYAVEIVFRSPPDPLSVLYYLSGPLEMLGSLTSGLSQRGVTPDYLSADAWE